MGVISASPKLSTCFQTYCSLPNISGILDFLFNLKHEGTLKNERTIFALSHISQITTVKILLSC